jgi:hypothetical protein
VTGGDAGCEAWFREREDAERIVEIKPAAGRIAKSAFILMSGFALDFAFQSFIESIHLQAVPV